mgnify:CR=1 FL=1
MNKHLSRQELENEIAELKKQNETFKSKYLDQKEEREDYLHTIINCIGDPIFVKDEHSRLLLFNEAFCKLFELKRADIIGKTLAEDVHPDERESFLKIDKQVLANGVENINEETITVRGKPTRKISTRKTRFIDSEGEKFLVGIIHDITERKQGEENLRNSETQLIKLNNTKDKIFSIIAHDLKGPFYTILEFSKLLNKETKNIYSEAHKNYLDYIDSSVKRSVIMLDNLLNWAKSQTGQANPNVERINLSTLINDVIEGENTPAKVKKISLKSNPSNKIDIYSHRSMLKVILRNLISNAVKFTKSGGEINISHIKDQNHVEFTVSDNGVGITKDIQDKLFDLSENVITVGTENEIGSGLGLVLCKELVTILGGKIWVESVEGKGSDFKFNLPLNNSQLDSKNNSF